MSSISPLSSYSRCEFITKPTATTYNFENATASTTRSALDIDVCSWARDNNSKIKPKFDSIKPDSPKRFTHLLGRVRQRKRSKSSPLTLKLSRSVTRCATLRALIDTREERQLAVPSANVAGFLSSPIREKAINREFGGIKRVEHEANPFEREQDRYFEHIVDIRNKLENNLGDQTGQLLQPVPDYLHPSQLSDTGSKSGVDSGDDTEKTGPKHHSIVLQSITSRRPDSSASSKSRYANLNAASEDVVKEPPRTSKYEFMNPYSSEWLDSPARSPTSAFLPAFTKITKLWGASNLEETSKAASYRATLRELEAFQMETYKEVLRTRLDLPPKLIPFTGPSHLKHPGHDFEWYSKILKCYKCPVVRESEEARTVKWSLSNERTISGDVNSNSKRLEAATAQTNASVNLNSEPDSLNNVQSTKAVVKINTNNPNPSEKRKKGIRKKGIRKKGIRKKGVSTKNTYQREDVASGDVDKPEPGSSSFQLSDERKTEKDMQRSQEGINIVTNDTQSKHALTSLETKTLQCENCGAYCCKFAELHQRGAVGDHKEPVLHDDTPGTPESNTLAALLEVSPPRLFVEGSIKASTSEVELDSDRFSSNSTLASEGEMPDKPGGPSFVDQDSNLMFHTRPPSMEEVLGKLAPRISDPFTTFIRCVECKHYFCPYCIDPCKEPLCGLRLCHSCQKQEMMEMYDDDKRIWEQCCWHDMC